MPVDRGTIDGQLKDIGEGERWWEQREFRDLPYILNADERLHGLINGKLLGRRRPRLLNAPRWLIVATSQRLILLKMERFGRQQVDVPVDQISGLRHTTRLRGVEITIETPQRKFRIRVSKEDAFRFVGALTPLASRPGQPAQPSYSLALPPVAGLLAWVSGAPIGDYVRRSEMARLEDTVERLEREVERLQQHVEFLDKLLQKRSEGAFSLPDPSNDS